MTDHNRPFSDEERAGLYRAIYERRDALHSFYLTRFRAQS